MSALRQDEALPGNYHGESRASNGISARDIEVLSADDPTLDDAPDPVVGGTPAVPPPVRDEDVAEATDGSIAGRLRAVGERLAREQTKDFDIPGTPLVMRARAFRDRKAFAKGVKTEAFIVRATQGLYLRDEDTGDLTPIPMWSQELAGLLGIKAESASQLVERILDNPVRLEAFGVELIRWMQGRNVGDEEALGE